MSNTNEEMQMVGLSPTEQAKKAIRHTLVQIKENPVVGWHCGWATQTFDLLTEALTTLSDGKFKLDEVRVSFEPTSPQQADQEITELLNDVRGILKNRILGYETIKDILSRIKDVIGGEE